MKKQILTEKEKKYLSAVIKPYKINYICKRIERITKDYEFLIINLDSELMNNDMIILPHFKKNTLYKGMEPNKEYSLQELGLE